MKKKIDIVAVKLAIAIVVVLAFVVFMAIRC